MKSISAAIWIFWLMTLVAASAMAGPGGFCPVGVEWAGWDPDWIDPGTIAGDGETFYMLVDPNDGCSCPLGFEMTTLTVYLTYPPDTPTPVTITVSMGLTEAVAAPEDPLPLVPGATICETPVQHFTSYIPKDYVGFGMALDCDCATMDDSYFIYFTIHSTLDPHGGFYTNGAGPPAPGRCLTRVDDQWVDLAAAGLLTRGDFVLDGSARCCEVPVATTDRSWSNIRSLYR